METLLIAEGDSESRRNLADLFSHAGFDVRIAGSVFDTLVGIRQGNIRVVVLGSELNEIPSPQIVPLLKRCSRNVQIILVSEKVSAPETLKVRSEGIFFHALPPADAAGGTELIEVVRCAFSRKSP